MNAASSLRLAVGALMVASRALAQETATNDPAGRFDAATRAFMLPELADAQDSYTVVIDSGGESSEHPLPKGTRVLGVDVKTVPNHPWTWHFFVSKAQLPKLDIVEPRDPKISYNKLTQYSDGVLLLWKIDPKAKSYKIITVADKQKDGKGAPDWGKETTEDIDDDGVNVKCGCVHYVKDAKPGDRFRWRAVAISEGGMPVSQTDYQEVDIDRPWYKAMSQNGIKFQRSDTLAPDVAGKPALFGYQSAEKPGSPRASAYNTQFALIWEDPHVSERQKIFYPRASLEAKLTSSAADKAKDVTRLRAGGYAVFADVPFNLTANLKYDAEHKTETKKGSLELTATPTFLPLLRYYPTPDPARADPAGNFSHRPAVQAMATLQFGAEVGRTFDVGSSEETARNLLRGRVDFRLDTQLNFLANALQLPGVTLYGETTFWRVFHQDKHDFDISTVGASFMLAPGISLDYTYASGRDAPTFTFSRTSSVSLGVLFK